jgi:hypothetical protein
MMETPEEFPELLGEPLDVPDFPTIPPGEEPDVIEFPDEIEETTLDDPSLENAKVEGE